MVRTCGYGAHAQAILIAGYPSDDISVNWLWNGLAGCDDENKLGDRES